MERRKARDRHHVQAADVIMASSLCPDRIRRRALLFWTASMDPCRRRTRCLLAITLVLSLLVSGSMRPAVCTASESPLLSLSTPFVGQAVDAAITWRLAAGIARGQKIYVYFPAGWGVSEACSAIPGVCGLAVEDFSVNGVRSLNVARVVKGYLWTTVSLDVSSALAAGDICTVQTSGSGLFNPRVPGPYRVGVSTDAEPVTQYTDDVSIQASRLSDGQLVLSSPVAGSKSGIDVRARTGVAGALTLDDHVYLRLDPKSELPSRLNSATITFDGAALSRDQIDVIDPSTIVIAVPVPVAALDVFEVAISERAGILNPSESTMAVSLWSDREPDPIELESQLRVPFRVVLTLTPSLPDGLNGFYLKPPAASFWVWRETDFGGDVSVHYNFDDVPGDMTIALGSSFRIPEGVHTIRYWGLMSAPRLVGPTQTFAVALDTTPPVVSAYGERGAADVQSGRCDLVITASEDCLFSIGPSGQTTDSYGKSSRLNVPLSIGANTFVVTATDRAGNTGRTSVVVQRKEAVGRTGVLVLFTDRSYAILDGNRVAVTASLHVDKVSGRILAPVRFLAEQLGASVLWNAQSRRALLKLGAATIELAPGSDIMFSNGRPVRLETSAVIIDGLLYVPLRAVVEGLGATVKWDAVVRSATIVF